ncbi:hypothetical protein IAT40_002725 [Kwoniella sp. CBS 6097]
MSRNDRFTGYAPPISEEDLTLGGIGYWTTNTHDSTTGPNGFSNQGTIGGLMGDFACHPRNDERSLYGWSHPAASSLPAPSVPQPLFPFSPPPLDAPGFSSQSPFSMVPYPSLGGQPFHQNPPTNCYDDPTAWTYDATIGDCPASMSVNLENRANLLDFTNDTSEGPRHSYLKLDNEAELLEEAHAVLDDDNQQLDQPAFSQSAVRDEADSDYDDPIHTITDKKTGREKRKWHLPIKHKNLTDPSTQNRLQVRLDRRKATLDELKRQKENLLAEVTSLRTADYEYSEEFQQMERTTVKDWPTATSE